MSQTCCPVMDLQWTQRIVDEHYADLYFCASCGHVHRTEKYAIPLRFPYQGRCVNCGGDQRESAQGLACVQCGKTTHDDKDAHDRLARLHPSGDYLAAAEALGQAGRHVLALKLATAETRWGRQPVEGMLLRIATLEALNEYDKALDESYQWAEHGSAPLEVWGAIAALEASTGNIQGAVAALERGLAKDPANYGMWTDYAELMVHMDERPGALRAASHALKESGTEFEPRAVAVVTEVGERYYAAGQFAEALGACSLTRELQEKYEALAWLRARIAAMNQDLDYLVKWLEVTVQLNPNHAEALAMLQPYQKTSRGWFGWKS